MSSRAVISWKKLKKLTISREPTFFIFFGSRPFVNFFVFFSTDSGSPTRSHQLLFWWPGAMTIRIYSFLKCHPIFCKNCFPPLKHLLSPPQKIQWHHRSSYLGHKQRNNLRVMKLHAFWVHFACGAVCTTMVKTKNQPHVFAPKDVSMDSCLNFPYFEVGSWFCP